jgi:DGQHR domain-containing protein
MTISLLRLPALEIRQNQHSTLYQFGIDGKKLDQIATVSRIHRTEDQQVQGYQRPEALSHIASIRRYLESDAPLVPNSLVIAFDDRVRFVSESPPVEDVRHGWIEIPIDTSLEPEDVPGWIVDGQQRSAAIRDARVDRFPIAVTAFITANEAEQREQFILVNSVKPLPKSLIYELLPTTEGLLPDQLARRRLSAILLDRLNYDPDSPFFQRIKMPTSPDGFIKDNSVLRMLDNSITDGALYRHRDPKTGLGDFEAMVALVSTYWTAVSQVFARAWDSSPRKSRLVHGVGIVAMGYLMDAIAADLDQTRPPAVDEFVERLAVMAPKCHWCAGYWNLGPGNQRKWNELQNVPRDIQLLTRHLLGLYRETQVSAR